MTLETLKMAEGTLTLVREGGKLVGVTFKHEKTEAVKNNRFEELGSDPERCFYCGTWVDFMNGSYYDFANHFLCRQSPSSMHRVMPVDQLDEITD